MNKPEPISDGLIVTICQALHRDRDESTCFIDHGRLSRAIEAERDAAWAIRLEEAESARSELVWAIHTLASHYENALYAFRDDAEALRKAQGDIAHAMGVAAKHNRNGAVITKEQP